MFEVNGLLRSRPGIYEGKLRSGLDRTVRSRPPILPSLLRCFKSRLRSFSLMSSTSSSWSIWVVLKFDRANDRVCSCERIIFWFQTHILDLEIIAIAAKMVLAFCETESINIKRTKNIISLFFVWINELNYFFKTKIISSRTSRIEFDRHGFVKRES